MDKAQTSFPAKAVVLVLGLLVGSSAAWAHRAYMKISGNRADEHGAAVVAAISKDASLRFAEYRTSSGTLVFKGNKTAVRAASARADDLLSRLNKRLIPREQTNIKVTGDGHDWRAIRSAALDYASTGALVLSPTLVGTVVGYAGGNVSEGFKIGASVNVAMAAFLGLMGLGNN